MSTGLVYDDRFLDHCTGVHSPEQPDRLRVIVNKLKATRLWEQLDHLTFLPASMDQLLSVHDSAYLDRLRNACNGPSQWIDVSDTNIGADSFAVARLAVGGVIAAADAIMTGRVDNAFCAVRPPGHHAEKDRAMGFCLLNNIAIAAEHLIRKYGLKRIAIVDFDVHHGNGTQHIFENRSNVMVISLHEHPAGQYPGTGFSWEKGTGDGLGYTLNITFDPGEGDDALYSRVKKYVLPALAQYQPQIILLSAGFDASEFDPLGHLKWSAEGFFWLSRQLKTAACNFSGGKLLSILEGGYHLPSLAEAVALHVGTLLDTAGEDPLMSMKAGL